MSDSHKTVSLKEITAPQLYRVNSFVARGCEGNPAGVCLLPCERDERFYKDIAVKIGCPETGFVYKKDGVFQLRWFTRSGVEVDLCGHATLAAAWILWNKGYVGSDTGIHFDTKSGVLSANLNKADVVLDFPLEKVIRVEKDEYGLGKILGLKLKYLGRTRFDFMVVVNSETDVIKLTPDFELLKKIPARGVIVTAESNHAEYDFVSRFFAPAVGIDEDPVTGSAHCALAFYWGSVLKKNGMVGYQASKEGGMVGVDIKKERVLLSGKAREVPVSEGIKREIL